MDVPAIDFAAELTASVQSVREYLRVATSLAPAPPSTTRDGWIAVEPGGRSPWMHMREVGVTEVAPFGVLVTFVWRPLLAEDESVRDHGGGDARRFAVFLGAGNLVEQFQLDRWITTLDLGLDGAGWRDDAVLMGGLWFVRLAGN
ncbi:hypothetical protein [Gordonia alkaliphila]|uniref:Uncharacterized protein n=1 Tax=Gordonia alkaliphila TaxID=1053547 RepID=A0ABP8Z9B8_9ACTN